MANIDAPWCCGRMQRLYTRVEAKFIPIGWWCSKCHSVKPESKSMDLGPSGTYRSSTHQYYGREVTTYSRL